MAGASKPSGVGAEVLATDISGVDGYSNLPTNLFNGVATESLAWGMNTVNHYIKFTVDKPINIYRTPAASYLTYQTNGFFLYKLNADGTTWDNVTSLYPQATTNLAYGTWEKFVGGLPAGTYKFTGTGASSARIDNEWYMEDATPAEVDPDAPIVERVNWNATGSIMAASGAPSYVYAQSIGYTRTGILSLVRLRCANAEITSCKLFLVETSTMKVIAVSPLLTAVGGIADWSPGIYVGVPFMIGIAPANGRLNAFTTKDPAQLGSNVIHYTNAVTQATISVGSTIPSTNWGTSYQLASEATFITNLEPTNYEGIEIEVPIAMPKQRDWENHHILDEPTPAYKLTERDYGLFVEPLEEGAKSRRHFSSYLDEVETGALSARTYIAQESDQIVVAMKRNNLVGVLVGEIETSSNAENRFRLTVTATHQYKSRLVSIVNEFRGVEPLTGRTRLIINGQVKVPYTTDNASINTVVHSIPPTMLDFGKNYCRLEYLYVDGTTEYLDFDVFKEEPKRITVERTFKEYDGGYDGERFNPAYSFVQSVYPCFMVPDGSTSTLIKTTDYTSIPLVKYTNIQGVNIDGAGLRILVSFDKGLTWMSFVGGIWQSVSPGDIAVQGMDESTINTITLAQWADIFKPTSIDFAIHMDTDYKLQAVPFTASNVILNGLTATSTSSVPNSKYVQAIVPLPKRKGKWYYEHTTTGANGWPFAPCVASSDVANNAVAGSGYYGQRGDSPLYFSVNGVPTAIGWGSPTPGLWCVSADMDNKVFSVKHAALNITGSGSIVQEGVFPAMGSFVIGGSGYSATIDLNGGGNSFGGRLPSGYTPWGLTYLKSINVQITPSLRTGYAFIM
jgi:hypothetical protein